jgi:hypothetical protein
VNFALILEALKFYKVKNARAIQIWFVLLYGINLLFYILPIGERTVGTIFSDLLNSANGAAPTLPVMTDARWISLGFLLAISLVNSFFTMLYATLYTGEREGLKPSQCLLRSLAAVPPIILLGLMVVVPAVLSACLIFIPLVVFGLMMYFLPLNLALDRKKLGEAIQHSILATQGFKLMIFVQVVLISLLVSLPRTLIMNLLGSGSILAAGIIASFFAAAQAFMEGRLMGMLYLIIVRKVVPVVPSKPKDEAQ